MSAGAAASPGQDQQNQGLQPPSIKRTLLSAIPIVGPVLMHHSLLDLELKRRKEDQVIGAKKQAYDLADQYAKDTSLGPDIQNQMEQIRAEMAEHNIDNPATPYKPDVMKRFQDLLGKGNQTKALQNMSASQALPAALQPPPGNPFDQGQNAFTGTGVQQAPPPGAGTGMLPQGSSQVSTAPGRPPIQPPAIAPPPTGPGQGPAISPPPQQGGGDAVSDSLAPLLNDPNPRISGPARQALIAAQVGRANTAREMERSNVLLQGYKSSGAEEAGVPFVQYVESAMGQKPTAAPPINVEGSLFGPTGKLLASVPKPVTTPQGAVTNLFTPVPMGPNGPMLSLPPESPLSSGQPQAASPSSQGQPFASVPPLLPPEQRVANSMWEAEHDGQKITPDKYGEAMARYKEISDPLGTQVKRSTLATQASSRETQAMNRSIMQNELDLANDPDVIGYAATQYRATGQMPQLGMRSQALRGAILKTAAQQAAAEGNTGEADVLKRAQIKADTASLTDLTKRKNQIGAFEKTAGKNLDVFLKQAQDLVDSGSPLVNRVFRGGQRELTGGLEGFDAARVTAFTEISRVLSGSMSAQLSDAARKEAEGIIRGDYTIPGMIRAAQVLRTDMKNRMDSFDEQIKQIRQGISPPSQSAPKIQSPPGTSVPAAVSKALESAGPGIHKLSDGTSWMKARDGTISRQ